MLVNMLVERIYNLVPTTHIDENSMQRHFEIGT